MQILQNIWTALTTENATIIALQGIPLTFIEAYLSMLLFITFFNIHSSKKTKLIFTITLSILSCITRYYIPDPYSTFLNLIICPILVILIFRISILKAIICEIFPLFLCALVDFVILKFFYIIFGATSSQTIYIPIYRLIISLTEYFSMYILYIIMKKINININIFHTNNKKQKIILSSNFVLGILAVFCQMYICIYYVQLLPISLILVSISSLISYFVISIYSLINTNNLNIAKQNLEETRLMNKTLTILNDKIRAFRHDFNNIIQALGGYIQAKDMDGLEKYYSQLLKDCQEVNNLTGLNPESINNPAIYSLLASKYYLATEKGIEFNLDIFMDLNSIDMKIYEFCRILGILLDNAIQATQECEEKHITVTIRKDTRCKRQLLIVENTYKEKDIDTEKIFEKGYSTKEGNTGLGLWEVRQILLKNTNLNLFTSKDDKYFKQQLEIYKS